MTELSKDHIMLRVADFSVYPIGRDARDGDHNGELFRQTWLLPSIREAIDGGIKLVVSFKGVLSFGSSFLEEAFAGLVSKEGLDRTLVLNTLVIEVLPDDPDRYDGVVRDLIIEAEQG
jgi:hypothetical protein